MPETVHQRIHLMTEFVNLTSRTSAAKGDDFSKSAKFGRADAEGCRGTLTLNLWRRSKGDCLCLMEVEVFREPITNGAGEQALSTTSRTRRLYGTYMAANVAFPTTSARIF